MVVVVLNVQGYADAVVVLILKYVIKVRCFLFPVVYFHLGFIWLFPDDFSSQR